jgi:endonuclease/exonuclease/phosphatase (EEP) superfamily protein YafD
VRRSFALAAFPQGQTLKKPVRLKVGVEGLLDAAGTIACLCTLTGFMGSFWWIFDLTSHFRVQYSVALIGLAAGLCCCRKFKKALVFAVFAAVNTAVVFPYLFMKGGELRLTERVLRVCLINVRTENQRYELVETFIAETDPDAVVLEEVNTLWLQKLAGLQRSFPYSALESREDNFGIALFSKHPLRNAEIVYIGDSELPSVVAQLEVKGRLINILGTHPLPPGSREESARRNDQLAAIPNLLVQQTGLVVLLGDLNVTPWCYYFKKLVRESGLKDTSLGWGIQPTWPAMFLPLRIPIDHCLVSPDLKVVQRKIGRDVGSDHLPVVVDFGFTEQVEDGRTHP